VAVAQEGLLQKMSGWISLDDYLIAFDYQIFSVRQSRIPRGPKRGQKYQGHVSVLDPIGFLYIDR